jgi:uncharacterized protein Yka (UPF0111/DUF47 family)
MLKRLLPQETSFFEFFDRQVDYMKQAADELRGVMANSGNAELGTRAIKNLEHQADGVTHACISALHQTFITPFDRNHIHSLAGGLDTVIDYIDETARRTFLYEIMPVPPAAGEIVSLLCKSIEAMSRAIHNLKDLKQQKEILDCCKTMNELDVRGKTIYAEAVARLYKEETSPIRVMKIREIFESLKNALSSCDEVAYLLEGIVLESA